MVTRTRSRATRGPEKGRMKWGRWLGGAILVAFAMVGGVLYLAGAGYLRDIERAENLIIYGWIAAALVSIFATLVKRMLTE